MMIEKLDLYPITIIRDKYDGLYSRALYLAFNLRENEIPKEIFGKETECLKFWAFYKNQYQIGGGDTVEQALENLVKIVNDAQTQTK